MRVHVLQHVAFENLGSIAAWLDERHAHLSVTRFFKNDSLPSLDDIDMLIALGGPMSVNDESEWPWLVAEKRFVRAAVERRIPVLGICLGAQLIATALGARVYARPLKEIGWFPVTATATTSGTFAFPAESLVFHWHGETFDLPEGAIRLASSVVCENQAFQCERHVIGLQFHLETTPDASAAMREHCRHELIQQPYIQSETLLEAAPTDRYTNANRLMVAVLDYLAEAIVTGAQHGADQRASV